jgi:HTH-type transcriptional regulator/antitoxin MqsA
MSDRQCGSCGAGGMVRAVRDVSRDFRGQTVTIAAVDGWHCATCGEVEFASKAEAKRFFAKAQNEQQAIIRSEAEKVRLWRKRLGLTQKRAADLFGGGINAFSEYERGKTQPSKSTVLLLKLLDKHPELLKEIGV